MLIKFLLISAIFTFFGFGVVEMHVQTRPCHDFRAINVYPPIESPLNNNDSGAAKAFH